MPPFPASPALRLPQNNPTPVRTAAATTSVGAEPARRTSRSCSSGAAPPASVSTRPTPAALHNKTCLLAHLTAPIRPRQYIVTSPNRRSGLFAVDFRSGYGLTETESEEGRAVPVEGRSAWPSGHLQITPRAPVSRRGSLLVSVLYSSRQLVLSEPPIACPNSPGRAF